MYIFRAIRKYLSSISYSIAPCIHYASFILTIDIRHVDKIDKALRHILHLRSDFPKFDVRHPMFPVIDVIK